MNSYPPQAGVTQIVRDVPSLVRVTRQAHGLTMEAFGNMLGLTKQAISLWENGNQTPRMPKPSEILELEPGMIFDFWLDVFMVQQRAARLSAIERIRNAEQEVLA